MADDSLQYDVVVVGAGPAGLAAAIRLKQLAAQNSRELSVCLLEKAAAVGSHIISGAIMDPVGLFSLFPDWQKRDAPVTLPVSAEEFLFLSEKMAVPLPDPGLGNDGCYIVSLGDLTRWLGQQAESLGVEIYPGFAAARLIYSPEISVTGVITGEMGIARDGNRKPNYQPGLAIKAKQTLLAEGCRGHLSREVIRRFQLDAQSQPQCHGLGIKELWEVDSSRHRAGTVVHSVGWPLESRLYGGGFIYHCRDNRIALGLVVGLDYQHPFFDPYWAMQQFKTHPQVAKLLVGGRRIGFGARTLVEGGVQSLPKMAFPGGLVIGDAAGLMDVGRMKGSHNALLSGKLAAEAVFDSMDNGEMEINGFDGAVRSGFIGKGLRRSRNIRPGFKYGLYPGLFNAALESRLFRGRMPWTLQHAATPERMVMSHDMEILPQVQADGRLTFDKPESLHLAAVRHEEDQPGHLETACTAPEHNRLRTYCPARVFTDTVAHSNCLHCKTCDIKDFDVDFRWTPPEGGGGPNYSGM